MKEVLPSDYDLSEVHLVCHGPSAAQFKYTTGTVICFHRPTVDCDIVCTPAYRLGREGYWNLPTITTNTLYFPQDKNFIKFLYSHKSLSLIDRTHLLYKWAVYQVHTNYDSYSDSGQRAYLWALQNNAEKIHLWGFDNIWETREIYDSEYFERYAIFHNEENYLEDKKYLGKRKIWKSILQSNTEIHK